MNFKFFSAIAIIAMLLTLSCVSNAGKNLAPLTVDANYYLSAFATLTDANLIYIQQELTILASTSEAKSLNWEKMRDLLILTNKNALPHVIWFALPDGKYYTLEKGLMDKTLSDRAYFPGLMSGGNVMGDLVISKSTGKKAIIVAVPIKEGDKVIGALGESVFSDDLSLQLQSALNLPDNIVFYAIAPDGITVFNKNIQLDFENPRLRGNESLTNAINEMLTKPSGEVSYEFDNTKRRAVFRTSELTGWKYAIAVIGE